MKDNYYIYSPLNYIGGKKRLLNQIIPLFPKKISTFVDLFCGGCNVGINIGANKIIFNDNIIYLIDMYNYFKEYDPEYIIISIEKRIEELNLSITNYEAYLSLRNEYNIKRNPSDLFLLAAFSFNHQIRFNSIHQFNTPFGKNRSSYNIKMKYNLINFLNTIHSKNVVFNHGDFRLFDYNLLGKDDFVYADPPYIITKGTYNDGKRGFTGWYDKEEIALLNILKMLDNNGIKFALSNVIEHKGNENKILKEWINKNNYIIHKLSMNYKNSNYHTMNCDKGETQEILVTNF